jgi:cystathionine beta-lyase family protein involved in aluminum resistance
MLQGNEIEIIAKTDMEIAEVIAEHRKNIMFNQAKVLKAFKNNLLSDFHFQDSSGYGYGDTGREVLESIYADIFCTEDALVRTNIVSGTHAIYLALKASLQIGDLVVTLGKPYDTLQVALGIAGDDPLSLIKSGVKVEEAPFDAIKNLTLLDEYLKRKPKVFFIQRSRGYSLRTSLSIKMIKKIITYVKSINNDIIVVVDNCYGEFVEKKEPSEVGADLIAGSLIKNPGGGLAPSGGYIAGKRNLVEKAAICLTSPGLGKDIGSSTTNKRLLFQGLFLAPMIVFQAVETAIFAAKMMENMGYTVTPGYCEERTDIVQVLLLNNQERLNLFCKTIQEYSPVSSHFAPEAGDLPGYESKVIMAAGTFVQGASIELTADSPIREPYAVYLQGSLTAEHGKIAILKAALRVGNLRQ